MGAWLIQLQQFQNVRQTSSHEKEHFIHSNNIILAPHSGNRSYRIAHEDYNHFNLQTLLIASYASQSFRSNCDEKIRIC